MNTKFKTGFMQSIKITKYTEFKHGKYYIFFIELM